MLFYIIIVHRIIMDRQAYFFLLQQCIALDTFSDGHSDYWTFGLLNLRTIWLSDYRTIRPSDYQAFELSGLRTIGPIP